MIDFSDLGKIAIKTKREKFTYAELNDKINSFSQLISSNEKVAIYSDNRPEWIFAFFGAWKKDNIVVPIDYMSSEKEVRYILNDCKPATIFTSNEKINQISEITSKLEYTPIIINLDTVNVPDSTESELWNQAIDNNNTATIIYTSGTTGSPKGVMLSYGNLLANLNEVCREVPIIIKERQMLMLLPLHHVLPLVGTLIAPLHVGATIVMSPSMQSADLLETLKNNKVAIFIGVPRLYEVIYSGLKAKVNASSAGRILFSILQKFPNEKLAKKIFKKVHEGFGGHLEIMVCGGAALNPEVGGFFNTLGFKMLEGFGMTEAAPMITFNRPGKHKIGTPGQKLNTVDVEIRDGEIVAKGPNIMQGYYNKPEETKEILRDGWLYSGDLGYFDKKGYLYITGRKKEIIVLSNGKNINPVEIEEQLTNSTEYINEVAIHCNDDVLHALIVPNFAKLAQDSIKNLTEYFKNTVLKNYNEHSSSYKRVIQFTLLQNEIPRTRLGKIQRFLLADLVGNKEQKRTVQEPNTEEYKTIKGFIETQTNATVSPNDHLEFDIALDSLGKLSLTDFIDKTFGIKLKQDELLNFPSVSKLVDFITNNKLRHTIENINWSAILKEKVNLKLPHAWITQPLFKNLSRVFFKFYFKFKGKGFNNIPEGPCIIAPNHQSFFDGMFVASFLRSKTMRKTFFYAKKKHVNNALLRFLARKNNIIVMDIHNDLKESIQKLAEVLRMGKNIIIFPEGTRTKDGSLGDFKQMFAILSKELNIPIIPVAIKGAYDALPTGKKWPRMFTPISVQFLQPVFPENDSYDTLSKKVRNKINEVI